MPSRIEVFDPAMCCSTGVCGPTADPALAQVASDLEWLSSRGVAVARHGLSQEPQAFVANAAVRRALAEGGIARLPLVLADGRVIAQGGYPDRRALAAAVGLGGAESKPAKRVVEVELLALGLETCDRCVGTRASLEGALGRVADAARAEGVDVTVRTTVVESVEQAETLGFVSSPTIRVNGRDITLETKESACGPCGDEAGCPVDCRVWVYRGNEYSVAPEPLIVEAVLGAVRHPSPPQAVEPRAVPDNLRRFLEGRAKRGARAASSSGCCAPSAGARKPRVSKGGCC